PRARRGARCVSRQRCGGAGGGGDVGGGPGLSPGTMMRVGLPCVVVVVSRRMPPPATLPDVVVFWFGAFAPSMRARQSALSLGGNGLQRSIAFCRAEPLLSRRLRLRSSC